MRALAILLLIGMAGALALCLYQLNLFSDGAGGRVHVALQEYQRCGMGARDCYFTPSGQDASTLPPSLETRKTCVKNVEEIHVQIVRGALTMDITCRVGNLIGNYQVKSVEGSPNEYIASYTYAAAVLRSR